jgi:hypothetical protein
MSVEVACPYQVMIVRLWECRDVVLDVDYGDVGSYEGPGVFLIVLYVDDGGGPSIWMATMSLESLMST